MGQRANYIIISNNTFTIHYNHWRANHIISDLYLGENRFMEFVNECQVKDNIMDEPWIEGCVIVDKIKRQLSFWALELKDNASVIEYYLSELSKKWPGWKIIPLKNRMYDVEEILGIDYISKQEMPQFDKPLKETILSDSEDDWLSSLVIIKSGSELSISKRGYSAHESIIKYGEEIIHALMERNQTEIPNEENEDFSDCVVIDIEEKKIIVNESILGLLEYSRNLWPGYTFIMGDMGHLEALRLAGIDTTGKELTLADLKLRFNEMIKHEDNTDPIDLAKRIIKENGNVQFNPDFFDNIKPKRNLFEKLKYLFKNKNQ